jgi:hypothetical protein
MLAAWLVVSGGGVLAAQRGTAASPTGRSAESDGAATIGRLAWLAGCWEGDGGGRRIEEQWMAPRGGTMIGMSRTVAGGRTGAYEFMRIEEHERRLVFTARPSGQAEASFGSMEVTGQTAVFESPDHDFPQRIIYRRRPDGTLWARIEGRQGDAVRGVDFPMRRTACGGEAGR